MVIINFVIDIYKQVWDDMGLEPKEDVHLKTLSYRLDKTMDEFSKEIHKTLGYGLGDGYTVVLNEFEDIIFVRIEIFGRDTYTFITNYLESNGNEVDYPSIPVKQSSALIQVHRFDERLSQELINELYIKFGQQIKITHSERIFEKGASDWSLDLLLWLGNIPASIIATYIYDFFKRKKSYSSNEVNIIDDCDIENVLGIASNISGVNKNDLRIINFDYNEYDKTIFYFITSRYVDIKLTLNDSSKVINCDVDKKTQLHI
ncbi:hypothetical protein [Oceanobacillus sp. FSL W7-1309]|uniref:hypothetical protein n=1 Tax=Oceanobacillus sp. FSL W7-1309 TaxID=2954539 RepID=UPI0030FC6F48